MPMFLALNIWMTVSQRMVADWSWLPSHAPRALPGRDTPAKPAA